jgi:hypothetical protein
VRSKKTKPKRRRPEPREPEPDEADAVELLTDVRDLLIRLLLNQVCPTCRGGGLVPAPGQDPAAGTPRLIQCACRLESQAFLETFPAEMLETGGDPEDYATCSECGRQKRESALADGECSCEGGRDGGAEWVMQGEEPEEDDRGERR